MMEFGESATSEVISTPLLIGPGCKMVIFLFRELITSWFKPNCLTYSLLWENIECLVFQVVF